MKEELLQLLNNIEIELKLDTNDTYYKERNEIKKQFERRIEKFKSSEYDESSEDFAIIYKSIKSNIEKISEAKSDFQKYQRVNNLQRCMCALI